MSGPSKPGSPTLTALEPSARTETACAGSVPRLAGTCSPLPSDAGTAASPCPATSPRTSRTTDASRPDCTAPSVSGYPPTYTVREERILAAVDTWLGVLADPDRIDRAAPYRTLGLRPKCEKETPTGRELVRAQLELCSGGGAICALAPTELTTVSVDAVLLLEK